MWFCRQNSANSGPIGLMLDTVYRELTACKSVLMVR
jgi:hypothetical protein